MKNPITWNKFSEWIKFHYSVVFAATLVILLVFIVYGEDLKILFNEAIQAEEFNHILLVPFFAIFLFYLKRDLVKASLSLERSRERFRVKYLDEIAGLILCLVAFLIYWYGSHTFYPLEYHIMSIPVFLMGITLILSNSKVLTVLIFPILFFLFLIPPPMELIYAAGGLLANFEVRVSYLLLRSFGVPVILSSSYGPPTIQLMPNSNPTSFTVDLPCSGVYSLVAFVMFSAFLSFTSKASIKRKILMFIFGFFVFEILNIIRITAIVSIAYSFGEEIAMFVFHSVAGLFLIFFGMLLTLLFADKILKIQIFPKTRRIKSCPQCKKSMNERQIFCLSCGRFLKNPSWKISRGTWAKILLLLVGCWLVTISLSAPTFALAKESIEIIPGSSWENVTGILPEIEGYQLKFLYRDVNYERIAHQDAALVYAYLPTNYSKPAIYVAINVANSLSNLHSWEVCLITMQVAHGRYPLVSVLDSKEVQLLEGVPIIARYLAFKTPQNYTQITLYWFEKATFNTGITVEQKYVRINLIIITYEQVNPKDFEDQLLDMGRIVASYWEPIKTQSLISLGIPTLQILLAISVVLLILMKVTHYIYKATMRNRNLKIFESFATKREKRLLKIITEIAKNRKNVETRKILTTFNRKVKERLKLSELIEVLSHFEKYGFVERNLISVDNTPKLTWKINISRI